jgi:predicted RNA-binding protein YlxR (DUF448 family)
MSIKAQPRPRRVPQRSCVACRTTTAKREFVRVVRLPTGAVEVDPTGKKSGRGAYLCRQVTCWEEALKRNRLAKALRTTLTEESRAVLQAFAATLPAEAPASGTPGR